VPASPSPGGKSAKSDSGKSPPKKVSKRAPAPTADVPDEDEFGALVAADSAKKFSGPAPVMRKKKKERPAEDTSWKQYLKEDKVPITEFILPLIIGIGSLVIYVVVAAFNVPAGMPVAMYVGVKLGFSLVLMVITLLALFVAAAALDTTYGFVHTALVKIVAIVLTQAWLSDVLGLIPVPFVGNLIVWVAVFYMFVSFFDLDHLEAIRSMAIVRVVQILGTMLLFASLLGLIMSGKGGAVGDALAGLGGVADAEADDEMGDVPGGKAAATAYRAVTQQFGEALVAQDYPKAYALMSPGYQATVSVDDFAAQHRKAAADFGKPLKCTAGIGTTDRSEIMGPEFARFGNVPVEARRAWMHAELALQFEDGEMVRCVDCWLLLIESADGFRIGAFEYMPCD
jgi:hypothetical protein